MTGQILLHDSLASNRIILRCKLSAACYNVRVVDCTGDVPAGLDDFAADIVVLDRDVDPERVLTLCRDISGKAGAPMVVITASDAGHEAQIEGVMAGATAVLPKPLHEELLLATLRRCLRQRQVQAEMAHQAQTLHGMGLEEDGAGFLPGHVAILCRQPERKTRWQEALGACLHNTRVTLQHPSKTLGHSHPGQIPDVYVLAASEDQSTNSFSLLSELRSRAAKKSARVIVVLPRAPATAGLAAMALDLGADDVMVQGFQAQELAAKVSAQLTAKRRYDRMQNRVHTGLRLATRDALTGLYNRRFAYPRLERMAQEAHRLGQPLSVMGLDLDHFKVVNDQYGHSAGDAVLIEVANRLSSVLRPCDLLSRNGGEEFLVAAPGLGETDAEHMAERLRNALRHSPVELPGAATRPVRVTASIGVATLTPGEGLHSATVTGLLQRADAALYTAKADGRDTISMASYAA